MTKRLSTREAFSLFQPVESSSPCRCNVPDSTCYTPQSTRQKPHANLTVSLTRSVSRTFVSIKNSGRLLHGNSRPFHPPHAGVGVGVVHRHPLVLLASRAGITGCPQFVGRRSPPTSVGFPQGYGLRPSATSAVSLTLATTRWTHLRSCALHKSSSARPTDRSRGRR